MTYKYFTRDDHADNLAAAMAYVAIEKAKGKQAYMLKHNHRFIEVRSW